MAVYKVTLATKDGERKVKYIYPKTSADIVEYSNNKSVYAKIEELEYLINSIPKFKIRVVTELPTLDISETTVYLVKAQTEDTKNIFSEYIYVNNEWELLGVQTIDLSIYYTIDQIDEIVESLMEGINSEADINHIHSNVTPNPNGTAGFMSPEDKSKLDDIANGAQVNTIESIKVNNNAIVPNASDKSVNITIDKSTVGLNNVANINQSGAIKDITRDGITFTATKLDGTTLTFTQQDNNTTYSAGNGLSLEGTEFKLDHPISGVTQGTYGSAIKVPQIVVDDKGHITSAVNKNIPVMTKATSSVAGTAGFVPAPASGKQNSFLRGDATWSLPTKSDVGLGNVDNTKDADKPISTATQTALNNKSDVNHNHDSEYANIDHTHTKDEITDLTEATTTKSGLMSSADKNKLDNIASGAEANVQSDWNQSDTTADDFIKNKPSNLVQDANYVHTDNNFTNAEKTEVDTLIAGAEEVVFTIQNDNTVSIDIFPQPANLTTFWVNLWNSCSETETPVSTFNKRFVLKDTRNIDNADEYIYINITNIMRASPSGFAVRFIGQKINNGDIYVFNVESNLETDIDSGDNYIASMYFEFKIPQLEKTATIVDTVADFPTLNLYPDQVIITKGYSSVGDGGGSTYIVSETEPDVPWFISINDFYIGIEKKDEYSAAELGMFPNDENNTTKFNTLKTGCKCTIRFSAGTYLWDSLLITRDNHLYSFIGTNDKSPYPSYDWLTNHKNYIGSSTFFAPYWNGEGPSAYPHYQSYVMKIGGTIGGIDLYKVGQKDQEGNILCANDEDENNVSNYYFTGFNIKDISFTDAGKYISDSLLIIEYCSCINGNLQFKNSTCQCLKMRNCGEMFFDFISIRSCILPFPTSALWTMEDYTERSANISALTVNLLDVENFKSTILRISEKANFCASTINMVQIEGSLSQNKEHTLENGDKELALDGNTKTIDNVVYGVQTGNFVDLGKTEEELAKVDATTGLSLYEQGISTYELAIKIPLIDYTNVNAVIINSISLQSVGYQWWYWENDSSVKYVHSLLRGVGGFSIGMIAIDTVFHYFTINDNAANGWARFTDIAMIKCDKTQLIPAPIGGVTHDYRFITNGSTNIFKSTIPVFQGSYPDNIYLKSLIEQCGSPTPQLISYQIGVSPTAANVSAKTVSLSDFELESGVRACVKFAYPDNGGSSPTLNINNTGAKPICISHTVINSETGERETVIENINAGYLKANKTYQFAYNGSQYLIVSTGTRAIMSIEGRHEVAIVPRTIGSCEKISAIFSMTNANLYVRRYLNDTLIHETSFPVSTSYTVRILELLVLNSNQELVRKNYDSYEVIYVPDLSSSELAIINDNTKTKEEKIAELAALERPHNLALSYLKIE